MAYLQKVSKAISFERLTSILVFFGLLFTLFRLIRGTDNLYILALVFFVLIWVLNYKTLFDKKYYSKFILFLPFGVWSTISAFWSLEPFASFSRGLFYIFISSTAVLIGFLYKNKLSELFKLFFILNGIIVTISFLSLFSGLPQDAWTANHGMGFTSIFTHQNTLAAVLMFTLIGPTYILFQSVIPEGLNRESRITLREHVIHALFTWESIFSLILIISNLFFIYLSYSRAVMLALFIGGTLLVYLLGTLKTNLIFTFTLLISSISLFYIFGEGLNTYLKKGGDDYFARRNILWEPSYQAALNGGFIGFGYGVTYPTIESNYKKENRLGELKREKGNSILALVEETGVVGLILFLIPLFGTLKNYMFKNFFTFNFSISLLVLFLFMFFVHTQFEAWLVGVSSFYLFVSITFASILIEK